MVPSSSVDVDIVSIAVEDTARLAVSHGGGVAEDQLDKCASDTRFVSNCLLLAGDSLSHEVYLFAIFGRYTGLGLF